MKKWEKCSKIKRGKKLINLNEKNFNKNLIKICDF